MLRRSVSTGAADIFCGLREELPEHFARVILSALARGSTMSSPFLHTTRDFQVARTWRTRSKDFGQNRNYLVRIRRRMLADSCIVDMSAKRAQDSTSANICRLAQMLIHSHIEFWSVIHVECKEEKMRVGKPSTRTLITNFQHSGGVGRQVCM